jgi:hypothetical protein
MTAAFRGVAARRKAMQPARILYALVLSLMLHACSTPYRPPLPVHGGAPFSGLAALLARGQPVDIVLVHGMCTHDTAWAHGTVDAVMAALEPGYAAAPRAPEPAMPGEIQVVRRDETAHGVPVHFSALVWSPLTAALKHELDDDRTGAPAVCAEPGVCKPVRAKFNALLKDGLLDDCLADAVIYQGVSHDAIRARMMAALSGVITADKDGPAVLIAESLGSKMTFDALVAMLAPDAPPVMNAAAETLTARLVQVFMGANQLPLLGLADRQLGPAVLGARPDALQAFLALRHGMARMLAQEPLTVVAFTDPNDLLSYRLQATRYARPGVRVADVLVSNRPTLLGLVEEPFGAHLGYRDNPDVARLIVCGSVGCAGLSGR